MKWVILRMAGLVFLLTGVAVSMPGHDSEAHPVPSPCFDFVTGGGWFAPTPDSDPDNPNQRANFGFEAGYKNGEPPPPLMGNLNYIDHNTGMHVKATSVDTYDAFACFDTVHNTECADRTFSGSAQVNGVAGYAYRAEVVDDGEPGNVPKGHDRFIITVSGPGLSYHADSGGAPSAFTPPSDGIDGGNIQIHKPCNGVNPK
ncbi:MAG: hypothetical protein HY727_17675 [Candidatus Rokubacteria bacterium]|nr:hypothetical protein [Candidatus Rokubacteria bacterium]